MSPVVFVVTLAAIALLPLAAMLRRRPPTTSSPDASDLEQDKRVQSLRASFAAARRRRIEGDAVGQFLALAEILRELEPAGPDRDRLAAAASRARYAGELPSACELECLERRVERRLAALEPATEPALTIIHSPTIKARARRAPLDDRLARRPRLH